MSKPFILNVKNINERNVNFTANNVPILFVYNAFPLKSIQAMNLWTYQKLWIEKRKN